MKYITGIQALNIPCSLGTTGDWHREGISWARPEISESTESVFGEYGIEGPKRIEKFSGEWFVANHIRACLDLIASGRFASAAGMRKDFIDDERYDGEIFKQVLKLKGSSAWPEVNSFMLREYMLKWKRFLNGRLESETRRN